MKLYQLCIDDNGGTSLSLHLTQESLDRAAHAWCAQHWSTEFFGKPMPEDWREAWADENGNGLCGGDSGWIVTSEVDLASLGVFGLLFNAGTVFDMDTGLEIPGVIAEPPEFERKNPADQEAVAAWCRKRGPDIEALFDEIIRDLTPTRADAHQILREEQFKYAI